MASITNDVIDVLSQLGLIKDNAAGGISPAPVTVEANLTGGVTTVANVATVVTNANLTGGVTSVGNAATVVTNANLTGGVTSVGNAATVVTNANLTGGVTSVGNAATVVTNANLTGHITSTGNAAVLGSFTSAQLLAALTDETGTGAAVFATSPTLVTPALGTPTALVGTNITGTAVAFNINGTVGVTTPTTGAFTTTTVSGNAEVIGRGFLGQPAPALADASLTLTTVNLSRRILTSTSAAAVTATLPTGTLMDGFYSTAVDVAYDWAVINTGPSAVTIAAGVDHTVVGGMVVATVTSANFRSRRTAANVWVTYRV